MRLDALRSISHASAKTSPTNSSKAEPSSTVSSTTITTLESEGALQHPVFKDYMNFVQQWDASNDAELKTALKLSRKEFLESAQAETFKTLIASYGFTVYETDGDGNCFFYSLYDQLVKRCPEILSLIASFMRPDEVVDYNTLRKLAVGSLVTLAACGDLSGFIDNPSDCIEKLSKDRAWADDFVVSTLARSLGITIILVNSNGGYSIVDGGSNGVVYLSYRVGIHYDSLMGEPTKELTDALATKRASGATPHKIDIRSALQAGYTDISHPKVISPEKHSVDYSTDSSKSDRKSTIAFTSEDIRKINYFHQLFEKVTETSALANNTAITYKNESITYEELNSRSNQLAHFLLSLGIKPDECVANLLPRSIEAIISILAVMKAGAAFCSISLPNKQGDEYQGQKRFNYCLSILQPRFIFVSKEDAGLFLKEKPATSIHLDIFDPEFWKSIDTYSLANPRLGESILNTSNLAYICFTSGSTGKPKGVLIEHQGLNNRLAAHQELLKIRPDEAVAQFCRLDIDASLMEIMLALGTGAQLVLIPDTVHTNYEALTQYYNIYSVNIAIFTPTVIKALAPERFPKLRTILTTGENVNANLLKIWSENNRLVINGYGPSEVTIATSLFVYNKIHPEEVTIGQAIPGLEMVLLNHETGEASKMNEEGEIYITGIGIARGYIIPSWLPEDEMKRLELLNQSRFLEGLEMASSLAQRWYRTGDKARRDLNGNFIITGRYDRQIKIGERLIAPEQIEKSILKYLNCEDAEVYVFVRETEGRKHLIACISTSKKIDSDELHRLARDQLKELDSQMLPHRWYISESMTSGSWKSSFGETAKEKSADYQLIKIPQKPSLTTITPLKDIYQKITKIWRDVLLTKKEQSLENFTFGLDDHFHLLGGDSIAFADMSTALSKIYTAIEFPFTGFKKRPTIRFLANYIYQYMNRSPIHIFHEKISNKPAIFCVHPATGSVEQYGELAASFMDRSVYGLKARDFDEIVDVETYSVEALAEDYLRTLLHYQPSGPYIILGHSAGGIIAYEMSLQLQQRGEKVAIILLDSLAPKFIRELNPMESWYLAQGLQEALATLLKIDYRHSTPPSDIEHSRYLEFLLDELAARAHSDHSKKMIMTARYIATAVSRYNPATSAPDSILFVAKLANWFNKDKNLGWNIEQLKSIDSVECTHSSIIRGTNIKPIVHAINQLPLTLRAEDAIKFDLDLTKLRLSKLEAAISPLINRNDFLSADPSTIAINVPGILRKLGLFLLEDTYFKEEQRLYIPVDADFTRSFSSPFDLQERVEAFINDSGPYASEPKKVLLLLGEAGTGKTLFLQNLVEKVNNNYSADLPISIYIPLGSMNDPVTNLLAEYFREIKLSAEEVTWLKSQRVVFFLDAYDEAKQETPRNLYKTNKIYEWPKAKVVITCRTSHLKNESNFKLHFEPWSFSSGLPRQLESAIYIAPFNPEQIFKYIQKYLSYKLSGPHGFDEKWTVAATYLNYIEHIPGLNNLTQIPMLLRITLEVLPHIVKKYEHQVVRDNYIYTQRDLFKEYMAFYFAREESKLEGKHPGVEMFPYYEKFCEELAHQMGMKLGGTGINTINWPLTFIDFPGESADEKLKRKKEIEEENEQWRYFFGSMDIVQQLACSGAPLRKPKPGYIAFWHTELQAYFNTNHDITAAKALREIASKRAKTLTGAKTAAKPSIQDAKSFWSKKPDDLLKKYKLPKEEMLPSPEKALRRAASQGDIDGVLQLLELCTDIDSQDDNPATKRTALHWAIAKGFTKIAEALLNAGARCDIKDAHGKSAKEYAMESSIADLKDLFSHHSILSAGKK